MAEEDTVTEETPAPAPKSKRKSKKQEADELTELARACMRKNNRTWGSGRDRDRLLVAAGYDPAEVQREIARLRAEDAANG